MDVRCRAPLWESRVTAGGRARRAPGCGPGADRRGNGRNERQQGCALAVESDSRSINSGTSSSPRTAVVRAPAGGATGPRRPGSFRERTGAARTGREPAPGPRRGRAPGSREPAPGRSRRRSSSSRGPERRARRAPAARSRRAPRFPRRTRGRRAAALAIRPPRSALAPRCTRRPRGRRWRRRAAATGATRLGVPGLGGWAWLSRGSHYAPGRRPGGGSSSTPAPIRRYGVSHFFSVPGAGRRRDAVPPAASAAGQRAAVAALAGGLAAAALLELLGLLLVLGHRRPGQA